MTVLIVVPLQIEFDPLLEGFAAGGYTTEAIQLGRLDGLRLPALDLLLARGGHGKTQFGLQTQHLIDHAPPLEAVVCVGTAGALAPKLAPGDLVLASATVEHDYTQRFRPHSLPRFPGDQALLAALQRQPAQPWPFTVHSGIIASGDEDVIEVERAAALRQATEACAVAWEGAGGARASAFSGVAFAELRGISDSADHQAATHFAANLRAAMTNAATLIAHWRTR